MIGSSAAARAQPGHGHFCAAGQLVKLLVRRSRQDLHACWHLHAAREIDRGRSDLRMHFRVPRKACTGLKATHLGRKLGRKERGLMHQPENGAGGQGRGANVADEGCDPGHG